MTLEADTKTIIADAQKDLKSHAFDPSDFVDKFFKLLDSSCAPGGDCDLKTANWEKGKTACFDAARFLREQRLYPASEQLLLRWWHISGVKQTESEAHIYRADIAYSLMVLNFEAGDRGLSARWALLTQADDLLSPYPKMTGGRR
jgi:hypothetical protein